MKKKGMLITFASTAVLLGLYLNSNNVTVQADTINEQVTATAQNNGNKQQDQNTTQTDQNNDQAVSTTETTTETTTQAADDQQNDTVTDTIQNNTQTQE